VRDLVAYDLAGDALVQSALDALGVRDEVAFLKNNIDHHTGATFGCHENYLMRRETEFTPGAQWAACCLSSQPADFHWSGPRRTGFPASVRDFTPAAVRQGGFPDQPARGSHRQ
jgi:hypothetical protein